MTRTNPHAYPDGDWCGTTRQPVPLDGLPVAAFGRERWRCPACGEPLAWVDRTPRAGIEGPDGTVADAHPGRTREWCRLVDGFRRGEDRVYRMTSRARKRLAEGRTRRTTRPADPSRRDPGQVPVRDRDHVLGPVAVECPRCPSPTLVVVDPGHRGVG